jgi:non-reducing end alpha-L-arabinofuranosidase
MKLDHASELRLATAALLVAVAACNPESTDNPAASGGAPAVTGGEPSLVGGRATGGTATGGKAMAGAGTGGASTSGGTGPTGGVGTGGASAGGTAAGGSAGQGPCDIFATGHTPCVAAHSTVRLLFGTYSGPLYQIRRASDSKTQDVLARTGVADSATQDTFCAGTTCTISVVYDQSGKGNHLKRSQGGAEVCRHQDLEAVADALPLTLGGHRVYGIKVISDDNGACTPPPGGEGTGYRLNATTGIATGDDPETEYMVTSGDFQAYQNSGCCFDYGNVETTSKDDGAGTMEAIYFGGGAGWGHGGGSGPWVMADMENGIFSGSTNAYAGNTSVPYPYVTAVLIGRSGGTYALMAGNAQSGSLTTMWDGARPSGYTKMKKQGAIVLGTGGDNSDHGRGYFFEGVMTAGAATAAIMNQVQANIVAAGYGK